MSPDQFVAEVPSALEAVTSDAAADEQLESIHRLHVRHANQVLSVLGQKFSQQAATLARGELPSTCLLSVAAGVRRSDVERFAEKIREILRNLPIVFSTDKPKSERQVQDAVDGIVRSREGDLRREHPTIRFATKTYRPDFSSALYAVSLEVKYPRRTRPIGSVVDEIGADLNAHRKAGTNLIFAIYDPERTIRNDDELIAEVEERGRFNVFAIIIRQ
jgi:hypothetical protein